MSKITNKPTPGDVLSVCRGMYRHYGIYVGNGTVVHFAGDKSNELSARSAHIQKTTLEGFRKNGEVQIETRCRPSFSRKETVMRALNAVGSEKGNYSLPWNNCEHFANWCRYGEKKSAQVEQAVSGIAEIGAMVIGAVALGKLLDEI